MRRHHLPVLLALAVLAAATSAFGVEIPKEPKAMLDQARKEKKLGVEKVNKAREGGPDETALARAALKHFEASQALYEAYIEKVGETEAIDDEMSDLQSLLYWCRKMTPLRDDPMEPAPPDPADEPIPDDDTEPGQPSPPVPAPKPPAPPAPAPPPVEQPKPVDRNEEARLLFEEAEKVSTERPEDRMLIVARFFQIADQFKDTPWGAKALDRAMEIAKAWQRDSAAAAPPKSGGAPAEDPTLLRLSLRNPDPSVRIATIARIVKQGPKAAIPDLHDLFTTETDRGVRDAVFQHLVAIKDKRTLDSFQAFSAVEHLAVAEDTVRLIAAIGQDKHVRFMVSVILHHEPKLCASAEVRGIRPGALDGYISQVRDAYAGGLRRFVADQAKGMGDTGVKGLEKLFETTGLATREAILTLGVMGNAKSVKKIGIYMAKGRAGCYRGEAMAAIKIIGLDAVPYLIPWLTCDPQRMWTAWLLRDMTGQTFGGSAVDRWWAWWRANHGK